MLDNLIQYMAIKTCMYYTKSIPSFISTVLYVLKYLSIVWVKHDL